MSKYINQSGFTLTEMIISIVVTALFIELLFQFSQFYLSSSTKATEDLTSTAERMDATDLIRSTLADSTGAMTQNSIYDPNAPGGGGSWPVMQPTVDGSQYAAAVNNIQPLLYFRRIVKKSDNTLAIQATGTPCNNEFVLYKNNLTKQVRLRTLAYSMSAATCTGTNSENTTCPPGSTSSSCIADKLVLEDVSSINITYYNRNGVQLVYDSNNPTTTDMDDVEVANVTLNKWTLSHYDTNSQSIVTSSVRIALRNT